jgi:two-component system, NarL family, sensor histidine kinase UhpB
LEGQLDARPRPGLALQLLQIAREAVSNAQRHSGAEWIEVALRSRRDGLEMTIADNGVGFNPKPMPKAGHGLRNMASRARDIGADWQLETQPGKGVRLTVYLPAAQCVPVGPATPTTH